MFVCRLETNDRAAWETLWRGYLDFYNVELAPEVTDVVWKRLLDAGEDVHGLCALDPSGEIVGFVHFLFHHVTWSIADRCYLEDLYVSEAARGQGAGRRLIEAVYAAADERSADQVYWFTQENNETARRLYDRIARLAPFVKYRR
jgi:ribosomal protein S18 acetylase RimI-like enzyme